MAEITKAQGEWISVTFNARVAYALNDLQRDMPDEQVFRHINLLPGKIAGQKTYRPKGAACAALEFTLNGVGVMSFVGVQTTGERAFALLGSIPVWEEYHGFLTHRQGANWAEFYETTAANLAKRTGGAVVFLGHSMGGCTAINLAIEMAKEFKLLQFTAVTFGSPKQEFSDDMELPNNVKITRYMRLWDPVPQYPSVELTSIIRAPLKLLPLKTFIKWHHKGAGYTLDASGLSYATDKDWYGPGWATGVIAQLFLAREDDPIRKAHALTEYAGDLLVSSNVIWGRLTAQERSLFDIIRQAPAEIPQPQGIPGPPNPDVLNLHITDKVVIAPGGPQPQPKDLMRKQPSEVPTDKTMIPNPPGIKTPAGETNNLETGEEVPVMQVRVPRPYLASPKKAGAVWCVWWMSRNVGNYPTRASAKVRAKRLNGFLRSMQRTLEIPEAPLNAALGDYLTAASTGGLGFLPDTIPVS